MKVIITSSKTGDTMEMLMGETTMYGPYPIEYVDNLDGYTVTNRSGDENLKFVIVTIDNVKSVAPLAISEDGTKVYQGECDEDAKKISISYHNFELTSE